MVRLRWIRVLLPVVVMSKEANAPSQFAAESPPTPKRHKSTGVDGVICRDSKWMSPLALPNDSPPVASDFSPLKGDGPSSLGVGHDGTALGVGGSMGGADGADILAHVSEEELAILQDAVCSPSTQPLVRTSCAPTSQKNKEEPLGAVDMGAPVCMGGADGDDILPAGRTSLGPSRDPGSGITQDGAQRASLARHLDEEAAADACPPAQVVKPILTSIIAERLRTLYPGQRVAGGGVISVPSSRLGARAVGNLTEEENIALHGESGYVRVNCPL